MAVDTVSKRSSVLGLLPQPSSELTRYDRRQVLGFYSGNVFLKRSRYHHLAIAAFKKAWRLMSEPTLGVIGPISGWTLPADTSYDPHHDEFLNDDTGAVVAVSWSSQTQTEVEFLPLRGDQVVELDIPGIVTTDMTNVTVLWSSETEALVRSAWGVVLGDRLYVIKRWITKPIGIEQPYQIDLYLTEGE